MKSLFLAWQDRAKTRAWYPIGRLDAEPEKAHYRFGYTRGALRARDEAGLSPLVSFPDFGKAYESDKLFSLFQNRVLSSERDDFRQYLEYLDLNPESAPDPVEILAVSGGERETDNLQVFPKVEKKLDGSFSCRFFLHGWRHVNAEAQNRIQALKGGEKLQVSIEINNPATGCALQLLTQNDYHMLGWAPRFLVHDLLNAITEAPSNITAEVVKINPAPAPSKQRVLLELSGRWPSGYEPMQSPEFRLLL